MRAAVLPILLFLTACARGGDGNVEVAVIGEPADMAATGARLGLPGELVRAATAQGLVRIDEAGQVVPAIAERWIVTDDGGSYIFRIREMDLGGGRKLTARTVQKSLVATMARLRGTTLGLDLDQVRDVRAMTGRVIEIRLKSPLPGFLQLLAQPELGIAIDGRTAGPMTMTRNGDEATLVALAPELRGLPAQPDWAEDVRPVHLTVGDAETLTGQFSDGRYQILLGGTLATLPLVNLGPLSRGTIRLDSAMGLFGIDVVRPRGFLADASNRETLALALDRAALLKPFNIGGWTPTTRVVAPGLPNDSGLVGERWTGMSIEARRAAAATRVARWKAANGGRLTLSLSLPPGPGSDTLFAGLKGQYAEIGITLVRAAKGERGDLALRDRVARFAGARWFLNQFNCAVGPPVCSQDVDMLVELAVKTASPAQQAGFLANAETALTATNGYIPIGAPIRWSLVRAGVQGFSENPWAIHPLFPLTRAPI